MSFNLFSQWFGSKQGHAINSAVDSVVPAAVEAEVPGAAGVIAAVTTLTAHPAGTTATVVTTVPGQSAVTDVVDLGGKALVALDPNLPAQIDAALEAALAKFGVLGEDAAAAVVKDVNAELVSLGFTAPVVVAAPAA